MDQAVVSKTRNSVAWTVLSALAPFALLVWFHKTNPQLRQLSRRHLMNPWLLTVPTLIMASLAGLAVIFWLGTEVDPILYDQGPYLNSQAAPDSINWTDWLFRSGPANVLGLASLAVGVWAGIAYVIYLVRHIEAVTVLGGNQKDKTLMIVMAVLSLVSIAYLVLFVVYKSQNIINRAAGRVQTGVGPEV